MLALVSINSFWLFVDKAVKSAMLLIVGAMVIRYLGPGDYGKLAYIIAIVAFFQPIVNLGIDGIFVRDITAMGKHSSIGKKPEASHNLSIDAEVVDYVFCVATLRLVVAFVAYLIAGIAIYSLKGIQEGYVYLYFLVGISLLFQAADTFDLWNQSNFNSKRTVLVKLAAYLIANAFRVCCIYLELDLIYFAFAFGFEFALIGLLLYLTYENRLKPTSPNIDFITNSKRLISESWPLIVSGIAAVLYSKFDQLLLDYNYDSSSLGVYNAAILFATAFYFLPIALCTSIAPALARAKEQSRIQYVKVLKLTFFGMFGCGLIVYLSTYWVSDLIIGSFFGPEYIQSADILKIYAIANIPVFIGIAHGLWMVHEKKLIISVYKAISGAIISIVLCSILIPNYGLKGAAYSTVISLIVVDMVLPFVIYPKIFIELFQINKATKIVDE